MLDLDGRPESKLKNILDILLRPFYLHQTGNFPTHPPHPLCAFKTPPHHHFLFPGNLPPGPLRQNVRALGKLHFVHSLRDPNFVCNLLFDRAPVL